MNTPVSDDLRERLVRLETEVKHMSDQLDSVSAKVDNLVDLLNQARGARWLLMALAGVAGFAASKLVAFLPIAPR